MEKPAYIEISVKKLYEDLKDILSLRIVSGKTKLSNKIRDFRIQKPTYIFAGYNENISSERIQFLDDETIVHLKSLKNSTRKNFLSKFFSKKIPAVISEETATEIKGLITTARYHSVPFFISTQNSQKIETELSLYLSKYLSPRKRIHGVMMDILGVGVLIVGESGAGKSESALDLIFNGHRLISDDVVEIYESTDGDLIATSPEITRNLMEIRGVGIINIKDLFGVSSIIERKKIDLIIELEKWDKKKVYDRLGWEMRKKSFLGVELPAIKIPVAPGRNLSTIIEVAVRSFILRKRGVVPAIQVDKKLREWMK